MVNCILIKSNVLIFLLAPTPASSAPWESQRVIPGLFLNQVFVGVYIYKDYTKKQMLIVETLENTGEQKK